MSLIGLIPAAGKGQRLGDILGDITQKIINLPEIKLNNYFLSKKQHT